MSYNQFFENQTRRGRTGFGGDPNPRTSRVLTDPDIATVFDTDIDEEWANGYRNSKAPHSYFDYYFSGQDVLVTIDGADDQKIPLITMGFNVTQQKQPVYGAFSYTYDAVMRGTRIVSGEFSIATTTPGFMRDMLARVAVARSKRSVAPYSVRPLTEDDTNIQKYWGRNIDPDYGNVKKRVFSVHPPFSFVVIYGLQNISLPQLTVGLGAGMIEEYEGDNPLYTDQNERLVEADRGDQSSRIVLESCELTSVNISYTPDGSVCAETYQFFGRDYIVPPVRKASHMPT